MALFHAPCPRLGLTIGGVSLTESPGEDPGGSGGCGAGTRLPTASPGEVVVMGRAGPAEHRAGLGVD